MSIRNRVHYGWEYRSYQARKKDKSRQRTLDILNHQQDPHAVAQSDLRNTINRRNEDTPNLCQVVVEEEAEERPPSEPTTNYDHPAFYKKLQHLHKRKKTA